jgi:hypothetical protein
MRRVVLALIGLVIIPAILAGCGGSSTSNNYTGHWVGTWNEVNSGSASGNMDIVIDAGNNVTGSFASTNAPWMSTAGIQPVSTINAGTNLASWTVLVTSSDGTSRQLGSASGFVGINQGVLQPIQAPFMTLTFNNQTRYFTFSLTMTSP